MKKTHKVVMLPTEKASNICIEHDERGHIHYNKSGFYPVDGIRQYLYITSDDEIKEGDWYYSPETKQVYNQSNHETSLPCKKIVATTDIQITSDFSTPGQTFVPSIPESFIQAYMKAYNEGKPITEVDLEIEETKERVITSIGTMIVSNTFVIKTRPDNTVIIHQSKMYSREQVIELLTRLDNEAINEHGTGKCFKDSPEEVIKWIENNL
jgi:hypothetical protein